MTKAAFTGDGGRSHDPCEQDRHYQKDARQPSHEALSEHVPWHLSSAAHSTILAENSGWLPALSSSALVFAKARRGGVLRTPGCRQHTLLAVISEATTP